MIIHINRHADVFVMQEEISQLRKQIIRLEEDRTALQTGKAKVVADVSLHLSFDSDQRMLTSPLVSCS